KGGGRLRITGQLIDASSGAHLWADHFDGTLDDVFDLQDRVTASVVGAIEPRLRTAEFERAWRKPTESLDAYDLYLRAMALSYYTRDENRQAVQSSAGSSKLILAMPRRTDSQGCASFGRKAMAGYLPPIRRSTKGSIWPGPPPTKREMIPKPYGWREQSWACLEGT